LRLPWCRGFFLKSKARQRVLSGLYLLLFLF